MGAEGPIMSVFGRHDFVVHDDDAVVAAGREAYMRAWPNEEDEDDDSEGNPFELVASEE
ncbi:hypothetical protein H4N58_14330 [Mumia sp. ZJ1417]|uniref:hypothetical protein n=1 Tax=unclassified Mumia TaxID=2621872 RepID=UPI00141FCB4A|nr:MULTISPECIES: hypothetical protein [unclassified Mumia]QMW65371.1 hypothetical protein H4N58_14330 [Mumia sp. ZJ1417]